MIGEQRSFETREELARELARAVAACLTSAIERKGSAILAVSGGTTPALFFDYLSRENIAWSKTTITLVDERQVPEDHPRSNAALVRRCLLRNKSASARFVPLYRNPDAASLGEFDCVILGMGNDGHTASFFPGGDTLDEAINPLTTKAITEISAPGSVEPRLTFTLPRLLKASGLFLHIEGSGKRQVLERAMAGTDAREMPVRAVLNPAKPVSVYWCP